MGLLLLFHLARCPTHSVYPINGAFMAVPLITMPGTHVCSTGTVAAHYLRPTMCQLGSAT